MDRHDNISASYGMEITAEKTKLMNNTSNSITDETSANGQRLETVPSFKYPGSVVTKEGSEPVIISRIA